MRFVGMVLHCPAPDAKTIWLYRKHWCEPERSSDCSRGLILCCGAKGWLPMGGQIVDATVIEARRPRLTQADKDGIKGGGTPTEWKAARCAQINGMVD
jgi:IS5 family transposase